MLSGLLLTVLSAALSGLLFGPLFGLIPMSGLSASTHMSGITINPHAYLKTGGIAPGIWMLPNGRIIKPRGVQIEIDSIPLDMVLSADGKYLYITNGGPGRQSITVVNTNTERVIQVVEEESLYLGIVLSPDGETLYASGGGSGEILVYNVSFGRLSFREKWAAKGLPGGMCISENGNHLFYVSRSPKKVHCIDTDTGQHLNSSFTGNDPYTVVAHPSKKKIYVSCEGTNKIDIYDITFPKFIFWAGSIEVGKNPQDMVISRNGKYLFVANADDDSFSAVDLDEKEVVATLDLRSYMQSAYGTAPNAVALSPSGKKLFIAQASDNKVSVISLPDGEYLGAIPAAWYPTAVAVSPDGKKVYVANGKGTGTSPVSLVTSLVNKGTVQLLEMPGDSTLGAWADSVDTYNTLPGNLFSVDTLNFSNPVPLERGGATPIEYVIFVVRENKTYDAILGDWEKGDGDSSKCLYCYEETRNLHALVDRFGSGDNYYSNAEASIQGHEIVTAAIVNPYVEKQWSMEGRTLPIELDVFLNPATYPKKDFIFQNALRNEISFRDYGEAVGVGKDLMIFDRRYVHWGPFDPPVFWMFSKDVRKLEERIGEWEDGIFPQLIFMLFPNDHTFGYQWPFPTPEEMITDNDLATGQFIEWLSHSQYWERSVVFVIEDDPQQGDDHVDNHRSILLVASPWVKRGYVSPVHYCEANIHSTIQHILNFPPMTIYDEIAQPMWDIFTTEPDYSPFNAIEVPLKGEYNLPGTEFAKRSSGLNFIDPDEAEGLPGLVRDYQREIRAKKQEATVKQRVTSQGISDPERRRGWSGWRNLFTALEREEKERFREKSIETNLAEEHIDIEDIRTLFSAESARLVQKYRELVNSIHADFMPGDPLRLYLDQIDREMTGVKTVKIDDGTALITVSYRNGLKGDLHFIREEGGWKIDLVEELQNAVELLDVANERLVTMREAREQGRPIEKFND
jgi:DNA-binding beta-propeller fold protein YncE